MTLGDKIRLLRTEQGISQKELAKRVGVDQKQISRYENGTYEPSLAVVEKLSGAFGVTVDFLIRGKETKALEGFGIRDRDLYVYCQSIDKLNPEKRKAIKYILKSVILAGNVKE